MARDHARIHLDIWGDDDWLDLPVDAQCLYMTLYTSPGLSLCGAHEWNPGKLAQRAGDWTVPRIEAAAEVLSRQLFLIIDTDTGECLIRSWIKHDGLWRTPNMAVSVANARANLASRTLRGVVVFEVLKLKAADPKSSSWERSAVQSMLGQKSVDPSLLEPFSNGGSNGGSKGAAKGGSNPCVKEKLTHGVNGGSNGGPTPAIPTTATAIEIPPNNFQREQSPRRTEGAALARRNFATIPARTADAHHIAQAFSDSLPAPIESGLLAEIGVVADKCLRDRIPPDAIAAGMRDWALSDSWHPSQIPKFVTKAAAKAARAASGIGKPTQKAMDYETAAEQLIAALEAEA